MVFIFLKRLFRFEWIKSLFVKKPAAKQLEDIDAAVRSSMQTMMKYDRRRKALGPSFLVVALVFIILFGIDYYMWPPVTVQRCLLLATIFVASLTLLYGIYKILQWYLQRAVNRNNEKYNLLKSQKEDILARVKDTEVYNEAVKLLKKYDSLPSPAQPLHLQQVGTVARRVPNRRISTLTNQSFSSQELPPRMTPTTQQVTLKPQSSAEKSLFIKVLEYVAGDGPYNRYALICKRCSAHNGLALREEFPYMSFKCRECLTVNPARCERFPAPSLPKPEDESENTDAIVAKAEDTLSDITEDDTADTGEAVILNSTTTAEDLMKDDTASDVSVIRKSDTTTEAENVMNDDVTDAMMDSAKLSQDEKPMAVAR